VLVVDGVFAAGVVAAVVVVVADGFAGDAAIESLGRGVDDCALRDAIGTRAKIAMVMVEADNFIMVLWLIRG
jgi:hypothetical protein